MNKEDHLIKKTYRYKFSEHEICKKLGLKGKIKADGLWSGQSPHDEQTNGFDPKKWIYFIETTEDDDELERQ